MKEKESHEAIPKLYRALDQGGSMAYLVSPSDLTADYDAERQSTTLQWIN